MINDLWRHKVIKNLSSLLWQGRGFFRTDRNVCQDFLSIVNLYFSTFLLSWTCFREDFFFPWSKLNCANRGQSWREITRPILLLFHCLLKQTNLMSEGVDQLTQVDLHLQSIRTSLSLILWIDSAHNKDLGGTGGGPLHFLDSLVLNLGDPGLA